jgi:hypothetical protein
VHLCYRVALVGELRQQNLRAEFLSPKYSSVQSVFDYVHDRGIPLVGLLPLTNKRQIKVMHAGPRSMVREKYVDVKNLSSYVHDFGDSKDGGGGEATRSLINSTTKAPLALKVIHVSAAANKKAAGGEKNRKKEKMLMNKIEKFSALIPTSTDVTLVLETALTYVSVRNVVTIFISSGPNECINSVKDSSDNQKKDVEKLISALEEIKKVRDILTFLRLL